jgi:uncharacterized protein with PQ loop repeat
MLGQVLSWIFSNLSNFAWLFVFIPQLIDNYKNESSEAISYHLVFLLYVGDISSVISVVYKGLSSVLIYVGVYHIIFDIIFIFQIIYYRLPFIISSDISHTTPLLINESTVVYDNQTFVNYIKEVLYLHEVQLLLAYHAALIIGTFIVPFVPNVILGDFFAWLSTFIFLSSRLPQILLNYKRRSVEGLSFITFINVIIANQLFLASVLAPLIDIHSSSDKLVYFLENMPWIIGCSITTMFDIVIFSQFLIYRRRQVN